MFQLLEYSVHNLTEENRIQKFLILKKKVVVRLYSLSPTQFAAFFLQWSKKIKCCLVSEMLTARGRSLRKPEVDRHHTLTSQFLMEFTFVDDWLLCNLWFADKWIFRGITRQSSGLSSSSQMHLLDSVTKTNTLGCELSSHVIQNASLSETRRGWKTYASSTEASVRDYQMHIVLKPSQ